MFAVLNTTVAYVAVSGAHDPNEKCPTWLIVLVFLISEIIIFSFLYDTFISEKLSDGKKTINNTKDDKEVMFDDYDIIGGTQTIVNTFPSVTNIQPHVSPKAPTVAKHYSNNEYLKETKNYNAKDTKASKSDKPLERDLDFEDLETKVYWENYCKIRRRNKKILNWVFIGGSIVITIAAILKIWQTNRIL